MKTITKVALSTMTLVAVAAGSVAGTLAYLKAETPTAVNAQTVGNVKIEQIEQQRVDDDANQNKLEAYVPFAALNPCYYEGSSIPWAPENEWVIPSDEAWKVVEDTEGVIDKFVSVKNTGENAAYVRTIIALEVGKDGVNDPYCHVVCNTTNIKQGATWELKWLTEATKPVQIGDAYYALGVFTYTEALPAGETTIPNLKQIYLDKTATNEVMEAYGDTFNILVMTQAVQAQMNGLTPEEALNEAFTEITTANHPWSDTVSVSTADELAAAVANGGTVVLNKDIAISSTITVPAGVESELILNGNTLSYAVDNNGKADAVISNKGTLEISGSGTITFTAADPDLQAIPKYATNTITNTGTLTINDGVTVENHSDGGASYAVDNHGVFTLNGGTLKAERTALRVAKYNQANVVFTMNDGLLYGSTPCWIQLPGSNASAAPNINVTINGGTMQTKKASSNDNNIFYTYSYGNSHANTSITINGGEFLGGTVSIGSGYKGDAPTLNILGGTFEYDVLQWLENDTYSVLYAANN